MTTSLGYQPSRLSVHLTRDADFVQTFHRKDGTSWPAGTVVTLYIGDTAWPATITGATGSWNVDKTVVNVALAAGAKRARLTYTDSNGADVTWMTGSVVPHD